MKFILWLIANKVIIITLLFLLSITSFFLLNKITIETPKNSFLPPDSKTSHISTPINRDLPFTTSDPEELAKEKIRSLLPPGEQSGVVYKSSLVNIDYVSSADVFQVEILTPNIYEAKKTAVQWFASYGLSHRSLCTYRVTFYLNYEVKALLQDDAIKNFNPLPDDCQNR